MLFLSGGTGTPKLIRGFKSIIDESQISVVVNTADDIRISGNLVCPDIDTVTYTLADMIDDKNWWGIKGDTFNTHNFLNKIGSDEYMRIGDRDRAIHILRGKLLKKLSLTEATKKISSLLGIEGEIIPMSDDKIRTYIKSSEGDLKFQEWLIKKEGEPKPKDVLFKGLSEAKPSSRFKDILEKEDTVLIGPSNPITSITPIISFEDVRKKLKDMKVVAISPIINKKPVSGPADRLMEAYGINPTNRGLKKYYSDIVDIFIIDERNKNIPKNKFKTDTLMSDRSDEIDLAKYILNLI